MGLIEGISGPDDLKRIPADRLDALAAEIRRFLVEKVSKTGGHLGPNLGVVELTIALHRVFDSPRDTILYDTGHQTYVHKILTGRAAGFDSLRQQDGLSGYPSREESAHDIIENSHASTALSYADGIARARELQGTLHDRHVVAVVGDGSLTGGMAWEALNNIADAPSRPMVIVVNDNERSYSPTVGGISHHLSTLRTTRGYERFLLWGKGLLGRTPVVGTPIYGTLHGMKKGIKDIVAPQGMFEDLGLKYIGPVDGHSIEELEHALARAKGFQAPVIVHVITEKGRGYKPAEDDEADRFHGVGIIDPDTGKPVSAGGPTWTGAFAEALIDEGRTRPEVVAITAAMMGPTGLDRFRQVFPDRVFDVGIAEQHALTAASGMALEGLHPVVALYATFLNRAFDQLLMDADLHKAGVTVVLDRAGVTGDDGASHNGMWDMSILQILPTARLAAPRDGLRLVEELGEALDVSDAPTVIRFPKGALPADVPALSRIDGVDVLVRDGHDDVLIVSVGALAPMALEVAAGLRAQGIGVTVVDPRWVKPLPAAIAAMARNHRLVVTIEDGGRSGGVGANVLLMLSDAGIATDVVVFGIPQAFLDHGTRAQVLSRIGLTAQDVCRAVVERVAALDSDAPGRESAAASD